MLFNAALNFKPDKHKSILMDNKSVAFGLVLTLCLVRRVHRKVKKHSYITFFFRQNPNNHQLLVNGNINSVSNSNYRANRPTKVIAHGWNNNGNSNMNPLITSAFLAVADVNVIVLNWGNVAQNVNYLSVASQVPNVGQHLGQFINWLFNTAGGNFNQLHLIGFSLGAHVVGNAGRTIGGRAARITGKIVYQ